MAVQALAVAVLAATGDCLAQWREATLEGAGGMTELDPARTGHFVFWRLVVYLPLYSSWIYFMEWLFPPLPAHGSALQRYARVAIKVVGDIFVWTPIQHVLMFTTLTALEGRAVSEGIERALLMMPRTLRAERACHTFGKY